MRGHASHPLVGELSRPSEPPWPSQHTHAAVLVTPRLTIVDLLCFYIRQSVGGRILHVSVNCQFLTLAVKQQSPDPHPLARSDQRMGKICKKFSVVLGVHPECNIGLLQGKSNLFANIVGIKQVINWRICRTITKHFIAGLGS